MRTIAIVGAGRVGKSMARLWHEGGVFRVEAVFNRSREKARESVAFIGAGRPVWTWQAIARTDVTMIATADDAIADACEELADHNGFGPGGIVFHCSGAVPSSLLEPARACGASVASLHPVKSFADPATAIETFAGTSCAIEGDDAATAVLTPAAEAIGGEPFAISTEEKLIYHAANVFVCNYLPPLVEIGLDCYEKAGVERMQANRIIRPLVEETVASIFRTGTARALTGPVARGDAVLVRRQLAAVEAWRPEYGEIYRSLAGVAATLAKAAGRGDEAGIAALEEWLRGRSHGGR